GSSRHLERPTSARAAGEFRSAALCAGSVGSRNSSTERASIRRLSRSSSRIRCLISPAAMTHFIHPTQMTDEQLDAALALLGCTEEVEAPSLDDEGHTGL